MLGDALGGGHAQAFLDTLATGAPPPPRAASRPAAAPAAPLDSDDEEEEEEEGTQPRPSHDELVRDLAASAATAAAAEAQLAAESEAVDAEAARLAAAAASASIRSSTAAAACPSAATSSSAASATPEAAMPSATAAAPPPPAERTPAHSFADAEGGGLLLRVEVPELSSMGAAELEVSGTGFSLYVPQLYRLGPLAWPRPVDVDAARAKFLKKRGVLQVTLPDVCV